MKEVVSKDLTSFFYLYPKDRLEIVYYILTN
ncbi:hypothetical protein SAMN05216324_102319 [Chryseobacterium limigenitum]|uniref:Uncharacterized protein n=1 Tax=Chryseobacterium limigenitum TaxID=1612149 RepID=A0A1K2IG14_9FLAO|nr:hypothetical protein SAMN05216324_102319 [Chryseobacterium limigenitum]